MQKIGFILLAFVMSFSLQAQENTEVFLFEIKTTPTTIEIVNGKNISQNAGYDNQPSFYDESTLLYSRTQDSLTTIGVYDISTSKTSVFTNEPNSGFFSAQRIPNTETIVAVRQDPEGRQRLAQYDFQTKAFKKLLDSSQVGYFSFYDQQTFIASVLQPNQMDLFLINIEKGTSESIITNSGRSVQKIPNSNSMSYTVENETKNMDLYTLDFSGDEPTSYFVCEMPIGRQDYTWLDENRILVGSGDSLFVYDLFGEPAWTFAASLNSYGIKNITRMTVSPDGKYLAVAAEPVEN
ncbi:TolB-like translocation protein [Leeuwenhoekiella palythoae]|uniref:WD40-like Beta Propeller Repeat n=1 Tax=Leeuwenhoekiella palythoae TaxID=573501 RepID=A0A1M5Y197_9FLAO|nr:hypothetical protein [Leeuwenhoekiella palythoae]RXG30409.1 hypothetical protein DSM01_1159 [Leeuwenhoekiella palythoae]SHI05845.1 hypothetical protein SAMN04487999_1866 [Leeuwenhoekiella palythoae]